MNSGMATTNWRWLKKKFPNKEGNICRVHLKCDGTHAETRFCLSPKRTSPFKSVGASVQSTAGSRGVRISGSNAAYTMFRGSVKSTGYPLHSPVSPSLPLSCVTVCHHISTGIYLRPEERELLLTLSVLNTCNKYRAVSGLGDYSEGRGCSSCRLLGYWHLHSDSILSSYFNCEWL